jgi:DNA-binding transcriptional LysR family regulator
MYLDGRKLHYFVTVADLGSLGRAAEVLHVAQPALSRQIRLLEEQVGVPLMDRNARGMTLTPAGRAYYQSARQLLDQGQAASALATLVARGHVGRLRLGISEIYAWHPDVLRTLQLFRHESPGVTFMIEAMLSGAVTGRVLDGHLDLALATTGPLSADSPLDSALWFVDDYRLAVNESSALAKHPPKCLAELNGEDFVLFRRDQSPHLHDLMIHHFHQLGFSPHVVQEGTTHYTVLGLIAAGLGCSVLPASAGQRLPPGVRLVSVPDLNLRVPVSMVWRRDSQTPVIQRFVDLLGGLGTQAP